MRAAAAAVMGSLAATVAAAAPDLPEPDYFRGVYERIGRTGAPGSAPIDDRVLIRPEGQNLSVSACGAAPMVLTFDPWPEIDNRLIGISRNDPVFCLFHNNGDNYPIITCRTNTGGAFTLWPVVEGFRDLTLGCQP